MALHIGQIQGIKLTNSELKPKGKVVKIGIQLEKTREVLLNKKLKFEIGKTEILEFDDVEITSIQLLKTQAELDEDKENGTTGIARRVPVIIDYVYDDEE